MKYYILFNPLASGGKCIDYVNKIELPENSQTVIYDITKIESYTRFIEKLSSDDKIVICGGDGTLNRFINSIDGLDLCNEVLYLAAGSGNDFLNDLGLKLNNQPIRITEYIKNPPKVYIGDKSYCFINGIGYGIDGYCCKEVNRLKSLSKKASYTIIALKGFLYAYKPTNATVIVDGKKYHYKKVWLTPTMKGKFFGGGMMIAPDQDRNNDDGTLTVVIAHNLSKLKILALFPTIFKGNHIKYKKNVDIHKGRNISVKFDIPTAMQIDGETVLGVKEYNVKTAQYVNT